MKHKYKIIAGTIAFILLWMNRHAVAQILAVIGQLAITTIEFLGYPGLIILMAFESMIVPLPSEFVMPFAGFLAVEGKMHFGLVLLFSTIGSLIGSVISYYLGYYFGHAFIAKLGKYFFLDVADLKKTEQWFQKKGAKTIFLGRFIPVVRHLISIPAGIGKMNIEKFCLYTFFGAMLWNGVLAYGGYILGQNWNLVRHYSEYVSLFVAALLLLAGIYFFHRHVRHKAQT